MLDKVGVRIKELRVHRRYNQKQLADELYVSPQAVSRWELGNNIPDIGMLVKLSGLFDVTIDYLVKGVEETSYAGY